MKLLTPIFTFILFVFSCGLHAQKQYIIDGQTYTLKTEVEGKLTLLWNTIDGRYRYFSKKGDEIIPLTNTKVNGDYKEEFKTVLQKQTSDANLSANDVILTLPSLHAFFVKYNTLTNPNYSDEKASVNLQFRIGVFVGVTNSIFSANPANASQATAGADFELIDPVKLKRHSMLLRFEQTFESDDYNYSASELSLNYRFKFIKTARFDAFINTKIAALRHFKKEQLYKENSSDAGEIREISESDFYAPVTFGIGADYKIKAGYITFSYNDILGLGIDSNGEFPLDFSLGYKFNL